MGDVMKLELSSELVGKKWGKLEETVSFRDTTNFAAAFSDMNLCYFADDKAGGVQVPPLFIVTKTIPFLHSIYEELPREIFDTRVHYTEQVEFYKAILPGQKIFLQAQLAAVTPGRAGAQAIFKFEITDEEGEILLTEYHGVVLRGVQCTDNGKTIEGLPGLFKQEREEIQPLWEKTVRVERSFPYIYDACTRISFGIHTSPKFARAAGLPDILVPGLASIVFALTEIVNREADNEPAAVKKVSGRFTGMVFPEDELIIQLMHKETEGKHTQLFFKVAKKQGQVILKDGYVELS